MQVMKVEQEPLFTPIEVRITFETRAEWGMFCTLMGWDSTVPRALFERNIISDAERKHMSGMMHGIYCNL